MSEEDSKNLIEIKALLEDSNEMTAHYIQTKLALERHWASSLGEKEEFVLNAQKRLIAMLNDAYARKKKE